MVAAGQCPCAPCCLQLAPPSPDAGRLGILLGFPTCGRRAPRHGPWAMAQRIALLTPLAKGPGCKAIAGIRKLCCTGEVQAVRGASVGPREAASLLCALWLAFWFALQRTIDFYITYRHASTSTSCIASIACTCGAISAPASRAQLYHPRRSDTGQLFRLAAVCGLHFCRLIVGTAFITLHSKIRVGIIALGRPHGRLQSSRYK